MRCPCHAPDGVHAQGAHTGKRPFHRTELPCVCVSRITVSNYTKLKLTGTKGDVDKSAGSVGLNAPTSVAGRRLSSSDT